MKKKHLIGAGLVSSLFLSMFSCKTTSSHETVNISIPEFSTGQFITSTSLTSGNSYKGTLKSGTTYTFDGPITVNAGDTLLMQSGVKLLSTDPSAMIIVRGTFISLGTETNPNWITPQTVYNSQSTYKINTPMDPSSDPAFSTIATGVANPVYWQGIQCDTNAKAMILKWTHVEFVGGTAISAVATPNLNGIYKVGDLMFTTCFQNKNGYVILEDNWFYGTVTDIIRCKGGKIHIMRNTVEKMAFNDGDAFNVKAGTVGDMAYNLIIGSAKGGTKAASSGQGTGTSATNINMYNNTYINGGWRSKDTDRGANVDYESEAYGLCYNNIMVNCRTGVRALGVASGTAANNALTNFGNNFTYGDTVGVIDLIYPAAKYIYAQSTDIPNPATFYPPFTVAGFQNSHDNTSSTNTAVAYDAPQLVGKNNPLFVNYSLPASQLNSSWLVTFSRNTFLGSYDFNLQSSSPAKGKGYTGFSPLDATSGISNSYLKATVTLPNSDLGAFPSDGSGNKHTAANSH